MHLQDQELDTKEEQRERHPPHKSTALKETTKTVTLIAPCQCNGNSPGRAFQNPYQPTLGLSTHQHNQRIDSTDQQTEQLPPTLYLTLLVIKTRKPEYAKLSANAMDTH